ncbi:MAG: hypothetical protein AAF563_04815 [Pseudomonadota bacterium]
MSLRIVSKRGAAAGASPQPMAGGPQDDDGWSSRIAKLVPAEALGLYGTGLAVLGRSKENETTDTLAANTAGEVFLSLAGDPPLTGLLILFVACLVICVVVRYRATQDPVSKKPQWAAVIVAAVSFIIWVVVLEPPAGPVSLGEYSYLGALVAVIWGAGVPLFYKGDPPG